MDSLSYRVADIGVSIRSHDPDLKLCVGDAMAGFLSDEIEPDMRITAGFGSAGERPAGEKIFDSQTIWRLYRLEGGFQFQFTSQAFGAAPYKSAMADFRFENIEVFLHRPYFPSSRPVYPLEYPLDELLITHFLAFGRGVEIHACGVADPKGDGYLFVGHSGAGKSTMAGLWEKSSEMRVLSDDRIILRRERGRFWMYGTPWHGEAGYASPKKAVLRGVYLLSKDDRNGLRSPSMGQTVGRLLACSFLPPYSPNALSFSTGFFADLAETVPCHELRFVAEPSAVQFLRERWE